MERIFEYRLRPNRAQETALLKVLDASRRLYNDALAEWKAHFEATGTYLHIYEFDVQAAIRPALIGIVQRDQQIGMADQERTWHTIPRRVVVASA